MKTVLITGGTRGIGKATAELMRENGWNVIAVGSDCFDNTIWAKFNAVKIDALVNCCGVSHSLPIADPDQEKYDEIFNVNIHNYISACEYAFSFNLTNIVNVGSACALPGAPYSPGSWAYVASKHAVHGLTLALAEEGKPLGIRVNCVAPRGVDTDMFRNAGGVNPELQPIDVARVIMELCETDKTGMIVPV